MQAMRADTSLMQAFGRETGQAAKLNPARAATQAGGETEYVSCRRQCDDDDIPALEMMERWREEFWN